MDAKCDVNDEGGSLNFNPGVDVGLGLTGSLYQDSSPTITFHEHAREGKRHKESIDVSLRMVPETHISREMHFKIKESELSKTNQFNLTNGEVKQSSVTIIPTGQSDESGSDESEAGDENEAESPIEFHEHVSWYGTTLRMMPHARAHNCRSTLFVFPKEHRPKNYTATVDVYVGRGRRESVEDETESSEDDSLEGGNGEVMVNGDVA